MFTKTISTVLHETWPDGFPTSDPSGVLYSFRGQNQKPFNFTRQDEYFCLGVKYKTVSEIVNNFNTLQECINYNSEIVNRAQHQIIKLSHICSLHVDPTTAILEVDGHDIQFNTKQEALFAAAILDRDLSIVPNITTFHQNTNPPKDIPPLLHQLCSRLLIHTVALDVVFNTPDPTPFTMITIPNAVYSPFGYPILPLYTQYFPAIMSQLGYNIRYHSTRVNTTNNQIICYYEQL